MHIGHVVAASLHRGIGIYILYTCILYTVLQVVAACGGGGGGIPRIGVFLHSSRRRRYNTE